MSFALNRYANGDTDYVAKLDQDNVSLELAINALQAAIASSGVSAGPYLNALFGIQTAFIGSASYAQSTATTIITLSAGYVWRPDLGKIVNNVAPVALNFSGKSAATYYIVVDGTGVPSISTSSTFALYSVVWTGTAFGTITRLAPIVWSFQDWEDAQSSTALSETFTSLKARFEADETLIVGVTGNQAANKIYAGPASGAAAAPGFRNSVLADLSFAGSANGVATLDGSGKVPIAQLPAAVAGGISYVTTWNASTNSPALASGVGTKGNLYKVTVAGTTTLDGISQWNIGDSAVFDGTTWDKLDGIANEVISVAGRTGVVTLASGDVSGLAASATTDTTNASNITSGTLAAARIAAIRYDLDTNMFGVQTLANQLVRRFQPGRAVTYATTGHVAGAGTASTGTAVFTIYKNGSSVGTITFTASATGVFSIGSPISLNGSTDVLTIKGPATPDATLADMSVWMAGVG